VNEPLVTTNSTAQAINTEHIFKKDDSFIEKLKVFNLKLDSERTCLQQLQPERNETSFDSIDLE
jgi:hypothetical protein